MIKSEQLKAALIQNIERVCSELLPDGRMQSGEYRCAGIFGGKGDSLGVNIKKGIWKDFSDNAKGGDLISLFIARANGDKVNGMKAVYEFLGLKQQAFEPKPTQSFKPPVVDWSELDGDAYEYLSEERQIPDEILSLYDIKRAEKFFGEASKKLESYVFIYYRGKKPCYVKYVALDRKEDGKKIIQSQAGGLQVLFGMQTIPKDTDRLVITTGEIDALSFAAQGIPAVSVTNGDQNLNWITNCWDWLKRFKQIYLAFDMDESAQSVLETVAGRLGRERCYKVSLPYKDANKAHRAGEDLAACLALSKELKPARLILAKDIVDDVIRDIKGGENSKRGMPILDWRGDASIEFNLRPRELTIWTGFEGSGKSTFLYQIISWLLGCHGKKALLVSLEDPRERIVRYMMNQVMGLEIKQGELDADTEDTLRFVYDQYLAHNLIVFDHLGQAPLAEIIEAAHYSVARFGVEHVVIDSVARTDLDIEDNKQANEFMEKVVASMNETQAHYHLVAHAKKGKHPENSRESIPHKHDIKGSVQIPIVATNIIAVWRNIDKENILKSKQTKFSKEEVTKWADAVLAVRKQKLTGDIGQYELWFDKGSRRFRRTPEHYKEYPYSHTKEQKPEQPF